MQLFPWGMVRAIAAKVFVRADRVVRSASVGPPSALSGLTDLEKQAIRDNLDPDHVKESVKEKMSIFTVLKIVTVLSALYMGSAAWFDAHSDFDRDDFMCPRVVVCAPTLLEMLLLTGSRFTAGFIHPGIVISVISKCYATRSFLHHSWLGSIINLEPSHAIHTYFGYITLVAGVIHSILHAARYIYANEAYIMYETDAGRSGLIAFLFMFFIVLPMKFEYFRTKMSFQFRKSLHMLFLPMIIALCFHSVVLRYVSSILVVWYTFDRIYFTTTQSFLIDHPIFEAVGRGTMVTLDLPAGYTFKAGSYIYVNSPMINSSEWHPFSIIQVPGSPPRATFYAEAVGDWTKELFRLGLEQDRLPLWITAAQPSLMEKSIYYDNIVLVCTGAGITPAVSIIERFAKRKNLHLLWMSRDGGMVALFEKQLRKVRSTVHLTGTPDEEVKDALQNLLDPSAAEEETDQTGHAPALTTRMALLTSDSLSGRQHPARTQKKADDKAGEAIGSAHGDAGEVVVDIMPPRPDLMPPRQLSLSNIMRQSTDMSHHSRRHTATKGKREVPVKLAFGRPDIGAYLTETFAMTPGAPGAQARRGGTTVALDMSDSTRVTGRAENLSELEMSRRLNANQTASKITLMRPDATILEDGEQPGATQAIVNNSKGSTGLTSTMSSKDSDRQLRWLVLYCGANPKVEEAIEKTCDELNVNWQKEYFGAW